MDESFELHFLEAGDYELYFGGYDDDDQDDCENNLLPNPEPAISADHQRRKSQKRGNDAQNGLAEPVVCGRQ